MLLLITYLFLGAIGGIVIGLMGTGSSLIILPALSLIFPHFFPDSLAIRLAVATSVTTLAVGSITGAIAHVKYHGIPKKECLLILPGCVMGSLCAPLIAHFLPSKILHYYIGTFILAIALKKLWDEFRSGAPQKQQSPSSTIIIFMTMLCAILSGVAGIALGVLLIPFLNRYLDHKISITVNLIVASFYAVIVAGGYIVSGICAQVSIPWSLGYLYLPAFFCLAFSMAFTTSLGAKISHKIRAEVLRRIFYLFLLFASLSLLLKHWY